MLGVVADIDYTGNQGLNQVRQLQMALDKALAEANWEQIRRLDRSCVALIDKVIAANNGNSETLALVLGELKGVYAKLIMNCNHQVASMGR